MDLMARRRLMMGASNKSVYPAIGVNLIDLGWWEKRGVVGFYDSTGTRIGYINSGVGTYPVRHAPGATYEYYLTGSGWRGCFALSETSVFTLFSGYGGECTNCISGIDYAGYSPSKGIITDVPAGTYAIIFNLKDYSEGDPSYIRRLT